MAASTSSSDPTPALLVGVLVLLIIISATSFALPNRHSVDASVTTGTAGRAVPQAITGLKGLVAIDGDTFEASVPLWPDLSIHTRIRISGIDTPELHARCPEERILAESARDALQFLLEGSVQLRDIRKDKYGGRFIASAQLTDGSDLAAVMIGAGFARPYDGGTRQSWC
jgi:micrococcal nuclease